MGLIRRKTAEEGREWSDSPVASSAETSEEEQWILRARAGEEAAFAWLLARYRPRVVRLAAHVLRRPAEAEDVAQEAFIRAFRKIRAFRGEGRFYTWLYHIVLRVCLDRQRTARWHKEVSDPSQDRPAPVTSPTEAVDMRLLVARLLDNLSPPMRAALVLRELEGLEYEEIAEALEIPVGTVRSRLNAARAQFRGLWRAVMQEADHV
jgi:RNA polymerase sigma-70 factor (ECF subfamily)